MGPKIPQNINELGNTDSDVARSSMLWGKTSETQPWLGSCGRLLVRELKALKARSCGGRRLLASRDQEPGERSKLLIVVSITVAPEADPVRSI